ncbi:sensor histidine kinase [Sphingobium cloacae]|uniref:Putative sensor histidine kinase n=1 Tax=Sphingobium cloacae TaxID=120107 RepID=A0A1E1F4Y5_9SPHN|nr:ATP-binding protein [Sphingobium cloacae]BAV65584.1 putative sensor histidine kinase [Sphingobium cloacae]
MSAALSPRLFLTLLVTGAIAIVLVVCAMTLAQPRAGRLLAGGGHVSVRLATQATSGGIVEGRVTALAAPDGRRMAILPMDLIEDPDLIDSYRVLDDFFARQTRLAKALRDGYGLELDTGQGTVVVAAPAGPLHLHHRLALLPAFFWVQIGVGVAGLLIGGWIHALRPRDRSARLFGLAGAGMFVALLPVAIYSSREIALPGGLFRLLLHISLAGSWVLGAALISLFLTYPRRLVRDRTILAVFMLCAGAFLIRSMRLAPTPAIAHQAPVLVALAALALGIAWQWRASAGDPAARVIVRWFGVSVLSGCALFVALIILPPMFGATSSVAQGYAVIAFLAIYGGAAVAVARYRLFDLDRWALRILLFAGTSVMLVVIDAILMIGIQMAPAPSLGLALLVTTLGYLPVRDMLWQRFAGRGQDRPRLFGMVSEVAFALDHRTEHWEALLRHAFDPLSIMRTGEDVHAPEIREDGAELRLPAVAGASALRLRFMHGGGRLFGEKERKLAQDIIALLQTIDARRQLYDQAVIHERLRIARDLHDDVGARLLSALHGADEGTRPALHAALDDIRLIVSGLGGEQRDFGSLMAELRHEVARRLEILDIALDWPLPDPREAEAVLDYRACRALSSMVRELTSNILRHADARSVTIRISCRDGVVEGTIADDGVGLPERRGERQGNGLRNLAARAQALCGGFVIGPGRPGTIARFDFPYAPMPTIPEQGVTAPRPALTIAE